MRIQMGGEVGRILKELGVRNHSQNILRKKAFIFQEKMEENLYNSGFICFQSVNELCLRSGKFVPSSNNKPHYLSSVEIA